MLAQSALMNGLPARGLTECSRRASTSLPTPVSPSSSTVASVSAMPSSCSQILRMTALCIICG